MTLMESMEVESEKIHLTEKVLDNFARDYLALLADSELLLKDFTGVEDMLRNIIASLRVLEVSVSEQELQD